MELVNDNNNNNNNNNNRDIINSSIAENGEISKNRSYSNKTFSMIETFSENG